MSEERRGREGEKEREKRVKRNKKRLTKEGPGGRICRKTISS
jgi:hypothetical protein